MTIPDRAQLAKIGIILSKGTYAQHKEKCKLQYQLAKNKMFFRAKKKKKILKISRAWYIRSQSQANNDLERFFPCTMTIISVHRLVGKSYAQYFGIWELSNSLLENLRGIYIIMYDYIWVANILFSFFVSFYVFQIIF